MGENVRLSGRNDLARLCGRGSPLDKRLSSPGLRSRRPRLPANSNVGLAGSPPWVLRDPS